MTAVPIHWNTGFGHQGTFAIYAEAVTRGNIADAVDAAIAVFHVMIAPKRRANALVFGADIVIAPHHPARQNFRYRVEVARRFPDDRYRQSAGTERFERRIQLRNRIRIV